MTIGEREVWRAAYGAFFAAQYFAHFGRGLGAAGPGTMSVFCEEAWSVADDAVDALRKKTRADALDARKPRGKGGGRKGR